MESKVFIIIDKHEDGVLNRYVPTLAADQFAILYRYLDEVGLLFNKKRPIEKAYSAKILTHPDDPRLAPVLEMLAKWGWHASPKFLTSDLIGTHFELKIKRTWEEADLDAAPLLRLYVMSNTEGPTIGYSSHRDGIGIGSISQTEACESWGHLFGYASGYKHFVAAERIRPAFEGLRGLEWRPVVWDEAEKAMVTFYEISSTLTMPPCLTPLVAYPISGDLWYDEPGYHPPELAYDRTAVEAMGEFDIAWTREATGMVDPRFEMSFGPSLIVSQRFRQQLHPLSQMDGYNITYHPVRLVD